MSTSERTLELHRIVKILAALEAFSGRRSEVLARLRVDESVFGREERAFRVVFAQLASAEVAALSAVYRNEVAALLGTRLEDLGTSMGLVDAGYVAVPTNPLVASGSTTRLAVIRAAHAEDETTAGGDDDTLRTPRPTMDHAAAWESMDAQDPELDPAAETTIRARRPRDGG